MLNVQGGLDYGSYWWLPPFALTVRNFAGELMPIIEGHVDLGPGLKSAHDKLNSLLQEEQAKFEKRRTLGW